MTDNSESSLEVWVNPACSKCRTAVKALDEVGAHYAQRRYLETPPTVAELTGVLGRLGMEPWEITRMTDQPAKDLGLKDLPRDAEHRAAWIQVLADNPRLIQRPIVVLPDGSAVVARDEASLTRVIDSTR